MQGENGSQDLDTGFQDELRELFQEEFRGNLAQLDLKLPQLAQDPENRGLCEEIFQLAHALRGNASFMGLTQIVDIARHLEQVFRALSRGALAVSPGLMDVAREAGETLRRLGERAAADGETADAEPEVAAVVARLKGLGP